MSPQVSRSPGAWRRATAELVAKALGEFTHEGLLSPRPAEAGLWEVPTDDETARYLFTARAGALDHWEVAPGSVRRDPEEPLDALRFLVELRDTLGIAEKILPDYLGEIVATLDTAARRWERPAARVRELVTAGFQDVEAAMTEGHPCFVANASRDGFDIDERSRYVPEAAHTVRPIWLAARRELSTFTCSDDLDYATLMASEHEPETWDRFAAILHDHGLSPKQVHLIPVHPWQWHNRIAITFASELAVGNLVYLGEAADEYRPQQSVRTLFNVSHGTRRYIKTALSVRNMGFVRGLSAEYMRDTPAINDWVAALTYGDELLRECRFGILREQAAVGYHHESFNAATVPGSPYRKMLAALWRESPIPTLRPGERLLTMAALLHTDRDGEAFVAELIASSKLSPKEWVDRYLRIYLRPLMHCFYRYGLAFIPHGENVILVVEEHVPARILLKDIAEEALLFDATTPLPSGVERIRAEFPEDRANLAVFGDIVDGWLRFLGARLHSSGTLRETEFWFAVRRCVCEYQEEHPELREQFQQCDFFSPDLPRFSHNRLQLRNPAQMVDLLDPVTGFDFVRNSPNPLLAVDGAPCAPRRSGS